MRQIETVKLDVEKFKKAIAESGYNNSSICLAVGMSDSYLGKALKSNTCRKVVFLAMCNLLNKKPEEFLIEEPKEEVPLIKYDKRIRRGHIYELIEKDGSHKNDILIISNDDRNFNDRMLSCIRINNTNNGIGRDIVLIEYQKKIKMVHAELVTYVHRSSVGKEIGAVSEPIMYEISEKCKLGLAL